jgi:hypothetical protein
MIKKIKKFLDILRFLKYTYKQANYIFKKNKFKDVTHLSDQLTLNGCVKFENFLTEELCEKIRNSINSFIATSPDQAVLLSGFDYRIYSFNKISGEAQIFLENELLKKILSNYLKEKLKFSFTLAQKTLYKKNNQGSGGGWHRDNTIHKYPKALVYLSDVTEENGCFQYINKTHKIKNILELITNYNIESSKSLFKDIEIEEMFSLNKKYTIEKFPGKAGTMILFDGRGIHRGSPLQHGERFSLTNYYYCQPGGKDFAHIK